MKNETVDFTLQLDFAYFPIQDYKPILGILEKSHT